MAEANALDLSACCAVTDFRSKLEDLAKSLPPTIHSEKVLHEQLEDSLNNMFRKWEKEQANIGHASRVFFGEGFGSEFKKIAGKLAEAAIKPETGLDAAKGALIGGLTGHVLSRLCNCSGFPRPRKLGQRARRSEDKPTSLPD